jgi:hypothetical protein
MGTLERTWAPETLERVLVDHDLGYEVMRRVAHAMEHRLQATRLQFLDVYGSNRSRGR